MITVNTGNKEVTIKRKFKSLFANDERGTLEVSYIEVTEVDGNEVNKIEKVYNRDYAYWKASALGEAILEMINLDLEQEEPSTPRY